MRKLKNNVKVEQQAEVVLFPGVGGGQEVTHLLFHLDEVLPAFASGEMT